MLDHYKAQSFIIKLLDKPLQLQFIQFAVSTESRSHTQMLTDEMTLLDMPDVNTFHTSLVVVSNNNNKSMAIGIH